MIKPNLICSHNWHVQPNCQRSVRAFRLSGALLDRGPGCYTKVSSNLLRAPKTASDCDYRRFCANFLNLSNFLLYVNLIFVLILYIPKPSKLVVGGRSRNAVSSKRSARKPVRISYFAQRKISNSDQQLPEPLGLARDQLSGHAMACSLRDSLQGLRDRAFLHLTLRTSFPLPSSGRPHGHREAPSLICNFLRVAHATLACNLRFTLR